MRIWLWLFVLAAAAGAQPRAVFYMTERPDSVRSFLEHASKIGILAPQMYSVDEQGLVWGALDPNVREAARRENVPVMPLIVNPGFRQETIHALLTNAAAQDRMIAALIEECRRHQWYGIQFDFENVAWADSAALSALFRKTARALAAGGFKLSIATVHKPDDYPGKGDFAHWLYQNWRGAFDLAALGEEADFVSVMAYDQHTRLTPPGPVAGMPWVEQVLNHALAKMPKEKISLGIPLYGRRWYAGMRDKDAATVVASVSGADAGALAKQMDTAPLWDEREHAPWFFFYRDGMREWVFYNDARAFRARWDLARGKQLHGFSAWVLGAEDPAIWDLLPNAR